MTLSNGQKKALHAAARELGMNDDERRTIQRGVGGFDSAASPKATRRGFIACMAFFEDHAAGKRICGFSQGYWAEQDREANPADALLWRCRNLASQMGWFEGDLDKFIAGEHMSNGAAPNLGLASAYWLGRTVSALQAMIGRKATKATKGTKENG